MKYVKKENLIVISASATVHNLVNEPNFCRTVPDETSVASVIIKTMKMLNIKCAVGLYSDNIYGKSTNENMKRQLVEDFKDFKYESLHVNSNFKDAVDFITKTDTDFVVLFLNVTGLLLDG